jgi:hypothetical protein
MTSPTAPSSPPHRIGRLAYAMRALGRHDLPETITINTETFRREQTIKHDFFAATGFYHGGTPARRVVLKMGRTIPFFGLPLHWLGRRLCLRELDFYTRLADLPNIPGVVGTYATTGFVHEFVPGQPLSKHRPVPDAFFAELLALLKEIHRRDIAYVDTNKPENVLLGTDGHPHLIDFQISYALAGLGNNPLSRFILRRLQRADVYHILKHKKRLRKDQITPEELDLVTKRGFFIHLHRIISKPYFFVRRRLFKWLRNSGRILPEGSK